MENQATPLPPISFWQKYRKSLWILLIFAAFATAALLGYVLFLKNPQERGSFLGIWSWVLGITGWQGRRRPFAGRRGSHHRRRC